MLRILREIRNNWKSLFLMASTGLILPLPVNAQTQSPLNAQGEVGLTSYATLPFTSTIFQPSWGSSGGLLPTNLFWQSGTLFTNKNSMAAATQAAQQLTAAKIVPFSTAQRWEDTYEISQPASDFPGEPAGFAADRTAGYASGPEYKVWLQWMQARPNLFTMASDGGSMPTYFRPWKGSWGHISPLMPMAAADCPNAMTNCTFGDWFAYRYGQTAALSGAYAVALSDFTDSQPDLSTQHGFNPEIIAAFEVFAHITVPAGTTSQRSLWINTHAIALWNDYLSAGYGKFYWSLSDNLYLATNQHSLVIDQCSLYPSLRRFLGTDQRIIKQYIAPAHYVCGWDDQTMQVGRQGLDPAWGVGAYAMAAAREPDVRNGANLEANDSAYWQAIASFNPTLSAAGQQEKGLKLLKRSWLEGSWAHVATRQGQVRRALAFISRDYWDWGTLDPTLQNLISSIQPTAPFGFAVYYSVAAERAFEAQVATSLPNVASYYSPDELLAWKNAGIPVDYFVSDAGLPSLQAAARPAAWLVLEHPELIPSAEMQSLTKIAPVLTSVQQIASFTGAPLAYSSGLTGFGFYDQNKRLIVTATNPTSTNITGLIHLNGLPNGAYSALDLFANQTIGFTVASGQIAVPLAVTRWDTRAFAITRVGN